MSDVDAAQQQLMRRCACVREWCVVLDCEGRRREEEVEEGRGRKMMTG